MPNTTTFLLVEDDQNDVFLLQQQFREAPASLRLLHVSDGVEAMRYLEGQGDYADRDKFPLPDVILLDLKMPRFSGFDFLQWLHTKSSDDLHLIPVVVMSSSALPEDITRAYALGVNSYMVKPVKWNQFAERVKALGIYWSEHVETPEVAAAHKEQPRSE